MKMFVASDVTDVKNGKSTDLFGAELDGKLWLGMYPNDMLHFVDWLYTLGKDGNTTAAVLADAIAFRFGMERK